MRVDHENHVIYLRQSGLSTYQDCPERSRFEWFDPEPEMTTDAAAIGTACHAAVEENLYLRKVTSSGISTADMVTIAKTEYDQIETLDGIRYVQGTREDAMQFIETCIPSWRAFLEPYIPIDDHLKLEFEFDVHLMTWHGWEVRLVGTMDCLHRYAIDDWKFKGQAVKQWEAQRSNIQSTVYSHAAVELGLLEWPVTFNFGVVRKLKTKESAERVPVTRHPEHVDWLCHQIDGLLTMWEKVGEQGPWPTIDSSVLCSPKWCNSYRKCKGKSIPLQMFSWKPS